MAAEGGFFKAIFSNAPKAHVGLAQHDLQISTKLLSSISSSLSVALCPYGAPSSSLVRMSPSTPRLGGELPLFALLFGPRSSVEASLRRSRTPVAAAAICTTNSSAREAGAREFGGCRPFAHRYSSPATPICCLSTGMRWLKKRKIGIFLDLIGQIAKVRDTAGQIRARFLSQWRGFAWFASKPAPIRISS